MEDAPRPRRWLTGLRRAWVEGDALDRWIDEHGVTGVVWSPDAWIAEDAAAAVHNLTDSGASADESLLWDLSVADIRAAATVLRRVYVNSERLDGLVAVWMRPERLIDPGTAGAAAREIVNEIGRPNVAVAFTWSGARAGALSAMVETGVPVAVGSPDPAGVRTAWEKGIERRRKQAERDDEDPEDVESAPVILLGQTGGEDPLFGADLTDEFGLVSPGHGSGAQLPTSASKEESAWSAAVTRLEVIAAGSGSRDDLGSLRSDAAQRAAMFDRDEYLEGVWRRDHTLWREEPTEIADRLGWLHVPWQMSSEAGELATWGSDIRASGVGHVVLCGMGGSSLAAETFREILGGAVRLTVLDSTDPDHVSAVTASVDVDRTLFIVSSKSGTTVETRSQLEHFWAHTQGRGDRFVAVTDPGSDLAGLAQQRGFRRVFENPPDIGGRYSALSYFGLVPAVACGLDVAGLCDGAVRMLVRNAPGVPSGRAPGVLLGAALGEAWVVDRDKLTFVLPLALAPLGDWAEQLIAESTGKDGTGILPVVGEDLGPPDVYGDDRVFCAYAVGDEPYPEELDALADAGHPVIRVRVPAATPAVVGAECVRWELATATVGYMMDIHPFDQPDVEAAKQRAREALKGAGAQAPERGSLSEALSELGEAEEHLYVALQAFLPPTPDIAERLQRVRLRIRDTYGVATTVGFGPRFLHSTGQLHKGGLRGVFIQVTGSHATDVDVPDSDYTFGRLIDAQADGDLRALRDADRRAVRVSLDELEAGTA